MTAKRRFLFILTILLLLATLYAGLGYHFQNSGQYELALAWMPWQPGRFEHAGLAAFEAGQSVRALELLRQAREADELSNTARQVLGELLWQVGNDEDAIGEWEVLLQGETPAQAAFEHLAGAYHIQGRLDEESRIVARGVALYPDSADLRIRRALWLMTESPSLALPLLESLPRVGRRDSAGLLSAVKQALSDENLAYQLTVCGRELVAWGEWSLAGRAFSRAVELEPAYAEAWGWLGQVRQTVGEPGAWDALQRGVALNPQSATLQAQLGLYWQRQNRWAQAQAAFEVAARLEPENPVWQTALGDVSAWLGDIPLAYAYYQDAVRMAPKSADTWRDLALFCARNESYLEEAGLPAALKARTLAEDDWRNTEALGRVLMGLGQNESARRMFAEAIRQAPEQASPFYYLGLLYLRMERRAQAEQSLRIAILLDGQAGMYADLAQRVLERYFLQQ